VVLIDHYKTIPNLNCQPAPELAAILLRARLLGASQRPTSDGAAIPLDRDRFVEQSALHRGIIG
jgi:hypothetical protein